MSCVENGQHVFSLQQVMLQDVSAGFSSNRQCSPIRKTIIYWPHTVVGFSHSHSHLGDLWQQVDIWDQNMLNKTVGCCGCACMYWVHGREMFCQLTHDWLDNKTNEHPLTANRQSHCKSLMISEVGTHGHSWWHVAFLLQKPAKEKNISELRDSPRQRKGSG